MKKLAKAIVFIFIISTLICCFIGCDNSISNGSKKTISFYVLNDDYEWEVYTKTRSCGNEIIKFPDEPKKSGYTFYGWFSEKTYINEIMPYTYEKEALEEDLNLYAYFMKNEKIQSVYLVNFVIGSDITHEDYQFGSYIKDEYKNLSKTGYIFKGWYKDPFYTKPWHFEYDKIRSNTTLYALFEEDKFEITY